MFRSLRFFALFAMIAVSFRADVARAEKLSIISSPAGAAVEIDGIPVGTTPFEKEYPGGFFRRTKTVFGARLEHPLAARLSLPGYSTKEIALTEGPLEWIGVRGVKHGEYWLFKSNHFEVKLDSLAETFTGKVNSRSLADPAATELSLESLASLAKPAVVQLQGLKKMGSGFFVTETGVIATNAHVAREEESLLVLLSNGQQLEGKVVYVDAELDVALIKVPGEEFPYLPLARADAVRQGESVVAIGNPGDAMQFSMTKGIVSAVGKFASAGPGTWVQTDAPINPGNSGGPLINMRGEVIGINTQKLIKKNVTGIGFALSASDLLSVLRRFYPENAAAALESRASKGTTTQLALTALASGRPAASVNIVGTEGAQIFVDDRPVGDVPSTIQLSPGRHVLRITSAGHADVSRIVELSAGNNVTIRVTF